MSAVKICLEQTISLSDLREMGWSQTSICRSDFLRIVERGVGGNTLYAVEQKKIPRGGKNADKIAWLIKTIADRPKPASLIEIDTEAEAFFRSKMQAEGWTEDRVEYYSKFYSVMKWAAGTLNTMRASGNRQASLNRFCEKFFDRINNMLISAGLGDRTYSSHRTLCARLGKFMKKGCTPAAILHGNEGNQSARVVNDNLDKLLKSRIDKKDKPFINREVVKINEFLEGKRKLYDRQTDGYLNPADYTFKGQPHRISASTAYRYVNNVLHKTLRDEMYNGHFHNANYNSPHTDRKKGSYSLSMVTADDAVFSRKTKDGWLGNYTIWDDRTGVILARQYALSQGKMPGKPTLATLHACIVEMMTFLENNDLGCPFEAEVEYHLIRDSYLFEEGKIFSHVTYCNSARSKMAEVYNNRYKYDIEKEHGNMENRWYGRKHFAGIKYKENGEERIYGKLWAVDDIIADDRRNVVEWNNSEHPDYPGKTRMDVFFENANPNCRKIEPWYHYRLYGKTTRQPVGIKNSNRIECNNQYYRLKNIEDLGKLKPNNPMVEPYWLPDADGNASTVYLYQDGKYIGEAYAVNDVRFVKYKAEQTEEDIHNMHFQLGQQSHFFAMQREFKNSLPQTVDTVLIEPAAIEDMGQVIEHIPVEDERDYNSIFAGYDDDIETRAWEES